MAAPPPPQPACPLLVPAGGTQQQQQPGMEKLNGPNPPWRRLLRSRSSTPTSPAPSRGLLARGGRSAGRGACARRRCAPAGGGCGCGPVAMRVVGTLCGARQTGASRSSRVSSRSHKQRTNNARTTSANSGELTRELCAARPAPVGRAAAPGFQCLTHRTPAPAGVLFLGERDAA